MMMNKLIDFYNTLSEKQKERLMHHVDNILVASKERSPRREKKKPKKKQRGAVMSPLGNTYYDDTC